MLPSRSYQSCLDTNTKKEKPPGSPTPIEKITNPLDPGIDKGFVFIIQNYDARLETSNIDLKAVLCRVDLHVVPTIYYVAQFLNRVLLSYTTLISLNQEFGLKGDNSLMITP